MTTFHRKLAIWRILAGRPEGLGLKALADRLEVAKNTIQRDIDELTTAGLQVEETQVGQKILYRIPSLAPLPSVATRSSDLAATKAATAALRPYRRTALLSRLQGDLAATEQDVFEATGPEGIRAASSATMEALLEGILEHKRCAITYTARQAKTSKSYEVEPYRFLLINGLIYLEAVVPPHKKAALFASHSVQKANTLDVRFRPKKLSKRTAFGTFEGQPEKVKVWFDAEIAPFIIEKVWHPSQRLQPHRDGSMTFRAKLSGMHEFVGWVMSWGPRAKLLKPLSWQRVLIGRARGIAQAYGHAGE